MMCFTDNLAIDYRVKRAQPRYYHSFILSAASNDRHGALAVASLSVRGAPQIEHCILPEIAKKTIYNFHGNFRHRL